jgi:glycosyltransferase involved in cell wall biosynthesis
LPLFPATIEQFDLKQYDLVISCSHCVAKGAIPSPGATHISYVFSPMRYIWDQYDSYFGGVTGIKKSFIKYQISKLRTWDVASSARVDCFVTISSFVKQRIEKYYRRDAEIIYPPVDVDFFKPAEKSEKKYFLTVSALVPYKNIGLLINTFNNLDDRLIIVGEGQDEKKLKKLARSNIEFKKNVSRQELKHLYQNAISLVFAGVEDFGIAFVEAQACGIPVVAYKQGGVLDIVKDGKTGILFENQNAADIARALAKVKREKFEPAIIRDNSLQFSKENFKNSFKTFLGKY